MSYNTTPATTLSQPPTSSSWTWANQASSVVTPLASGSINIYTPKNASGQSVSGRYIAAPSTPYHIIANVSANPVDIHSATSFWCPFVFGFTDTAKLVAIMPRFNYVNGTGLGYGLLIDYMASFTSINADLFVSGTASNTSVAIEPTGSDQWWMLRDDGTNIYFYGSRDGLTWVKIYSEARATHLTPSNIFFGGGPMGAADTNVTLNSYNVVPV